MVTITDREAADRVLGPRWASPWRAPTPERTAIEVHPIVVTELRKLLAAQQVLGNPPIGYSEFIMRAIRQWQADHDHMDDEAEAKFLIPIVPSGL